MTKQIVVYSKLGCPFCIKTKNFFDKLNVPFKEIKLDPDDPYYTSKRDYLFHNSKHRSFPIIFIGSTLLGGFSDLENAYDTLKLHKLCTDINIYIHK